jgi:hypothetical protein
MFPDFDRADRIGEFWGYLESRAFAELLIDYEEYRTLRAGPHRHPERGRVHVPLSHECSSANGLACS